VLRSAGVVLIGVHRGHCQVGVALFGLSAVAPSACKNKEEGAREAFAAEFTCPVNRIEVRPRPDVKLSDTIPMIEPPAEVKADPERLKMWRDKQTQGKRKGDESCEMFEARGCGEQTLLCCSRPPKHLDRISCSTRDYENGVDRW
jgi:hypothetical protein